MMRIRAISLMGVLVAVSCVAADCLAQQATQQTATANEKNVEQKPMATLHVQAREVLLPVTVRDKKGALVTDLNKSDFALTEDGRPQTIKSFTKESNLPFRVGLLVDTSRSVSGALENERAAAGKFVDLMLSPEPKEGDADKSGAKEKSSTASGPDEAFLIHFDREVELLQDFTSSREKLHRELEEMGSTRQREDPQGPETTGDERDHHSHGRNGTQLYDAIFLAADELMRQKDGRKALVVFSDGVDHGSKDSLNDAVDAADRASLAIYTIYFKGEEGRNEGFGFPGGGGHHGGGYPGGGGGYPGGGGGYPGGGGGYPGGGGGHGGGDKHEYADGKKIMLQIATRTGGHAYEAKKKEDLTPIYNQIAEELRGQYLLTYTPDVVDKDGGYHKIALKANKGDLTVATREGYYAPGGEGAK
jgi:VWFA-related protein